MVKPLSPLVIGIDFGMTCTGVAYAWNESMDVKLIEDDWPGSEGITQKKIPSIVVYKAGLEKGEGKCSKRSPTNPHANAWKFSSWGFRAQEESERNDPQKRALTFWKLFLDEEIVKAAYKNRGSPSFTQEDVATWYEDFFRGLYGHIEAHFVDTRPKLWESEVQFVFSVPTTWEEHTIDRFKKCFAKAGFGQKSSHTALVTLTEAQAAAVCTANEQNDEFEKGQYILICDSGGGTTDIALLEVNSDHGEPLKLKQIDRVYGKRAGSTQIDEEFESYACQQLERLQKDHPDILQDIQLIARSMTASRLFQLQKFTLGSKVSTKPFGVPVRGLPPDFSHKDSDIEFGKLMFTPKTLAAFFDERLKVIFEAVDTQLGNLDNLYENRRVDYMILSGGLGSSPYVKKKLEERYCKEKLYPNAAEMAILRAETPQLVVAKGLVTDHLRTGSKDMNKISVLQNWISPRSYGIVCVKPWDPYVHLEQDRDAPDELTGKAYAKNQITWIIKKVSFLCALISSKPPLLNNL